MITIVITDDNPAIHTGLRMRFTLDPDIKIRGEARDGKEALDIVSHLMPDIVIMDLEMPGMDGLTVTRQLQSLVPDCRIIVLTIHDDEMTRRQVCAAGAAGFVSKHADDVVLLNVVRAVANRSMDNM